MRYASYKAIHFGLIAAFAAVAVAPMIVSGIPGGNDAVQHFEFAQQVVDAINAGDLFPSFASNSNHGFGDVGLRVYPPAAYYTLAFFCFLVGSWSGASLITFFLIFLGGGIGVYLWANESFSPKTAITAAAIFTLMPFHLNEIYNNFLFAQFAASAVLPFCFLFTVRVVDHGRLNDGIGLAVSIALLIITHLPLTIIGLFAIGVYAVGSAGRDKIWHLARVSGSALAGVALSSFYWIRVLTEMSWVKHSAPEYFATTWSYSENYLISRRTFTEFLNDDLALWFGDVILIATLLLCIPGLIHFFRQKEDRMVLLPVAAVFIFAVFMTTPLSSFIWDSFPLLQRVQFPWRWLSAVSLMGAVLAAFGLTKAADKLKVTNSRNAMLGIAASVLPFVIVAAFVVRAPHFTPSSEFETTAGNFSAGETFEGWWPASARREAFSDRERVHIAGRDVIVKRWDPLVRSFEIEPGKTGVVTIATFYYPHWKAEINGGAIETRPDPLGLISFEAPEGPTHGKLQFEEPAPVKAAFWFSLAAWLVTLAAALFLFLRNTNDQGKYR